MIPENVIDQILDATDIAAVVSDYFPLKRIGRNYKACCPFHHEKTPSFLVSSEKGIFHCFGCGVGGNAISFVMKYENIEFPEAVKLLGEKAGIRVPDNFDKDDKKVSVKTELFEITRLAVDFYHYQLMRTKNTARDYLKRRGLDKESAQLFNLGYAPSSWDSLTKFLKKKSKTAALISSSGLCVDKDNGNSYDRFRDRVIFPIFDIRGRVVGLGGRTLSDDKDVPKYVNSPESAIYTKGKFLYGLNVARDFIVEKDSVVVVEGYMDMITPYVAGVKNIVASLGTALTEAQAKLIKRFTNNVVLIFDSDSAGQMATIRGVEVLWANQLQVKIVTLPKGADPDSFVRNSGAVEFQVLIDNAKDFFDFLLEMAFKKYSQNDPIGITKICEFVLASVSKLENTILQNVYIKKLASILNIDEAALRQEMLKLVKGVKQSPGKTISVTKSDFIAKEEKIILSFIFADERFLEQTRKRLVPEDFKDESTRLILSFCYDAMDKGELLDPARIMNRLPKEQQQNLLSEILSEEFDFSEHSEKERIFLDCLIACERTSLEQKMKALQHNIKLAQINKDEDELVRLISDFQDAVKQLQHLK